MTILKAMLNNTRVYRFKDSHWKTTIYTLGCSSTGLSSILTTH